MNLSKGLSMKLFELFSNLFMIDLYLLFNISFIKNKIHHHFSAISDSDDSDSTPEDDDSSYFLAPCSYLIFLLSNFALVF